MRRFIAPFLAFLVATTAFGGAPSQAASTTGTVDHVSNARISQGAVSPQASHPNTRGTNRTPQAITRPDGTIDIGPVIRDKTLPVNRRGAPPADRLSSLPAEYDVGDERQFIVLDDELGQYFIEPYRVALISDTVEIWVQDDLNYTDIDGNINPVHPNARDPELVTPERINALAAATERIIPTDVEYFGDYEDRDGSDAFLADFLGLPPDYYAGPPKSVIILISNVRDGNFYDPVNNPSYIAGFFSGQVNGFANRNIITIDSKAFDINTGPPEYQNEATIAHEFQHLINGDQDPDGEDTWANEGRSEFAEFINGYRTTPEGHRTQFSDFPENSLTIWGDQDADPDQTYEILADYQVAYWFFLYLAGRLQEANINTNDFQFVKDVARTTTDPANGSVAIDSMLQRVGAPFRFREVLNDFLLANLQGGTSDDTTWGDYITEWDAPSGEPIAPLDLGRLRRNLNFEGYDTPGAPPDGGDYVEIGWSEAITPNTQLRFNGDAQVPTGWRVIDVEDTGVPADGNVSGNILFASHQDENDNFLIFPVTVPMTGDQMLAFDTMYNIETGWDFGFTQVTTDTVGATGWTSLALPGTTDETDPEAHPIIQANVPGFSGVSGASRADLWTNIEYDLSDYAGQDILLAFRYATDGAVGGQVAPPPDAGWYLDNIEVGGEALFTDEATVPAEAQGIYQARGLDYSFGLRFVTFANNNGEAIDRVTNVPLNAQGDANFNLGSLLSRPGFNGPGERAVALISTVSPPAQDDLIGQPGYGKYHLSGLPSTLYTSRARALGTSFNTSLRLPRVYAGDTFTMTVTVDNLGRNDDLEARPGPAYVAVPLPAHTTIVADSLASTVATENITYTANLRSLDSGLPATPGVYWNGTVTDTADLSFELHVSEPLTTGTIISPTAHIANGPFRTNPSQRFTDLQQPVEVVSPFSLSRATGQETAEIGATTTFTYTLVNTDDETRDLDFRFTLPAGTELEGVGVNLRDPTEQNLTGTGFTLGLSVPSYLETGLVTVVTVKLSTDPDTFRGDILNPNAQVLQPGSNIPWLDLPLELTGGGTVITGDRPTIVYLPLVFR